ncbi:regulation and Cell signaling [Methylobacterium phyllosphaerae]|uniref:Regulation and Cell signaling n=1 Tax=Methylobacterium phyllosphaerae TaxID=418223 RepID=A0AAE8HT42_9HYPH|nr:type II toxin-antitoxin system PemK/MazF family toxin [Methylobacterium phyllosphaerae]APT33913.1 regulation and Cell signaling [Methylobacterium phyllosphaerae]SFH08168.1 transcriptional modulator of MazE/toxin, MazF [Methylobacterium phyllosphaerae]
MTIDAEPLEAGALVWVDLRPSLGREQDGVRPAVVVSNKDFHRLNATAIVCPITGNVKPWPTKVILPPGLAVSGAVLTDQIRCLDRAKRGFRHVGMVTDEVLLAIRIKLHALIGIGANSPSASHLSKE